MLDLLMMLAESYDGGYAPYETADWEIWVFVVCIFMWMLGWIIKNMKR